jgi:hypothetical protein
MAFAFAAAFVAPLAPFVATLPCVDVPPGFGDGDFNVLAASDGAGAVGGVAGRFSIQAWKSELFTTKFSVAISATTPSLGNRS